MTKPQSLMNLTHSPLFRHWVIDSSFVIRHSDLVILWPVQLRFMVPIRAKKSCRDLTADGAAVIKGPVPKTLRLDRCWRKSRIAARILLREEQGRLTARDVRIGRTLAKDPGVTARLIDQAIYGIRGRQARLERERRAAA